MNIKQLAPSYFVIANKWSRSCDCFEYVENKKFDNIYQEKYNCSTCGNKKDIYARFLQNSSNKGSFELFCSKHDILIDVSSNHIFKPRIPRCFDSSGKLVTSLENTDLNGFDYDFLKTHVINKEKIPDHNYGMVSSFN
jgi:hypothetical protein